MGPFKHNSDLNLVFTGHSFIPKSKSGSPCKYVITNRLKPSRLPEVALTAGCFHMVFSYSASLGKVSAGKASIPVSSRIKPTRQK